MMNTKDQPRSRTIYLVFLVVAIIISAVSALAQPANINTKLAFPEFNPVSLQSTNYNIVELPEDFDYTNLKIEIYLAENKVNHCYVCYSLTERSFAIDLSSFENGTYSVNVMNGKSTFFKTITVSN
jgi:hypothetical protein